MKELKFTQPFAMKCNQEQFESVKDDLIEMGYEIDDDVYDIPIDTPQRMIITYYSDNNDSVGIISGKGATCSYHTCIETWNRDLCLALASMTDKEYGIVGEWWKWIQPTDTYNEFTQGKLYSLIEVASNNHYHFTMDDCGDLNGWYKTTHLKHFTKATTQELIKHFTN